MSDTVEILDIKGETITSIETYSNRQYIGGKYIDCIVFECKSGKSYIMNHEQDCCEEVYVESIAGNLVATAKGYVTIRWYGRSNGSYSERVDMEETEWSQEIYETHEEE